MVRQLIHSVNSIKFDTCARL